jgi:hypothetical protein
MISTQGCPGVTTMVDATTLTVLATIVQTVVITLTLLVFIFQFRSQERAIRESSYQNLLGRYNDFVMSSDSADESMLARLLATEVKPDEIATIRRLMISYGIIEEAFELYSKGWIDKDAWEQWNSWLKALSKHPHFARLHSATTGMFNKEYQDYVSSLLGLGSN